MNLRVADVGVALPVVALLMLALLCAALGRWQLARAGENRALVEAFTASLDSPALALDWPAADPIGARYRRVELTGHYLPGTQILLDNMTHGGQAGFEVLTPFATDPGGNLVLVNRGWFPAGPDRGRRPALPVASAARTVAGWVDRFPRAAWTLENPPPADGADAVVLSYPSIAELEAAIGRPIAEFQVLLDPAEPDGFVREWQPDDRLASRNLAYAGQWFLFASMAAVGSAVVLLRNRRTVRV